jgi:hypothetical protein
MPRHCHATLNQQLLLPPKSTEKIAEGHGQDALVFCAVQRSSDSTADKRVEQKDARG